MSDTGRQSLTDKAGSAVKVDGFMSVSIESLADVDFFQPDSQKSITEQAGDYLKDKMDSAASAMQPNVSMHLRPLPASSPIPSTTEREIYVSESRRCPQLQQL